MAVVAVPYRKSVSSMLAGSINFTTDSVKAMLLTSAYTPNADTHQYKSDLTNEVSGTGYTATGVALASKSVTYTAANSWGTSWAATTVYTAGQIIKPQAAQNNGHIYLCQTGGTSAGTQPTWPTARGATVVDSGVTWEEIGAGVTVVTAGNPSWASATITARYCVYYDATPATDATRPLIGYVDFGSDVSSTNGTFQVTIDGTLGIIYFPSQ